MSESWMPAGRIVSQRGSAMRITDVAGNLGVTRQTICRYFPGTEALMVATAMRSADGFLDRCTPFSPTPGIPPRTGSDLRRYLTRWLGPAIAYPKPASATDVLRTPEQPRTRRR